MISFSLLKPNMSLLRIGSLAKSFVPLSTAVRSFALAPEVKNKLEEMVKKDKVVVFMKGVPEAPRCGFSNAVVQVLRMHAVPFQAYDVLSDESLREGVKEFSSWPTIPQVYVDGEFVGGCDILLQMHRSGDLVSTLKQAGITSSLDQKQ